MSTLLLDLKIQELATSTTDRKKGNITSNITTKSWLTLKDNEQRHRHHREQEIELQKI